MLLNDDFLLATPLARKLYHDHAEHMPIIDYHCHLDPQQICEDKRFDDLTRLWICDEGAGDHYKWRLMRANGVPERLITGDGEPYDKFLAYVHTMERAYGNPLYEWSHLELRRAFGIDLTICGKNAAEIWERANARIAEPDFSARGLMRLFDVHCVCTTDDPVSDLSWHRKMRQSAGAAMVLPTFRPDGLMGIDKPTFSEYLEQLSSAAGLEVATWDAIKEAASGRVGYFHAQGCRLADHGMNSFRFAWADDSGLQRIVDNALCGKTLSHEDVDAYQTALTLHLMGEYERRGWALQLHMNCLRNANSAGYMSVGADAGFDSCGDQAGFVSELASLLDAANGEGALPKTILYSLDESQWMGLATLMQSFQGGCRQKLQLGCAWWFHDAFDGIRKQLSVFAQESLLGNFTGMLTDSRSFLSYPRHEYFRRVLCGLLAKWSEQGRVPDDEECLGKLVEDISYNNARSYFGFDLNR